jgi:repressor LexA
MAGIDMLSEKDRRAFAFIRSKIIHTGKSPTLREINGVTGNTSPRSGSLVINRLIKAGLVRKSGRKVRLSNMAVAFGQASVSTVEVPLLGSVACGPPIFAEENIEARIPVSTALARPGSNYFLLRVQGDSMDRAGIEDRSILLVRQQSVANNGDKVVALINDEATVKVFEKAQETVILRPKSTNPKHKPIVLTDSCQIQGVVVTALPSDLISHD